VIGYKITRADLEKLIDADNKTWRNRAAERTKQFRTAGKFNEKKSIWSEIKPIYMTLQGGAKCIFCERKLESVEKGKGEQAVEHFRPKGAITAWTPSARLQELGVKVTTPPDDARGYFLLAYHLFNYTACCNPCNSILKSSKFPITGDYDYTGEDPVELKSEKPLLIYAVGDIDEDPEELIEFMGISPRPVVNAKSYRRFRALVSIEFFALDDVDLRKNLVRERAMVISALHPQLENLTNANKTKRERAERLVAGFTSPNSAHTNCAKSFKRLFESDPEKAERVFDEASRHIDTIS
jgi:hypothetical protein